MKQILKRVLQSVTPRLGKNPMARELFYYIARDFTPTLAADLGQYRYQVNTRDRTVGREVFLSGGFDTECIEHIFSWLCRLGFKDFRGQQFLDIGANIGTTSIPVVMERGFAGGIAVEPEPENFALLRQNVAANGLEDRIFCYNAAFSDCVGEAEMELCPVNLGDHRLRPRDGVSQDGIYHERNRNLVVVPTTTFDELSVQEVIPMDSLGVVWIDTQGHEGHVLNGAHSLLSSSVPVVVEFWPYALDRAGGLELFIQLIARNYTYFVDTRAATEYSTEALHPVSQLSELIQRYTGPALTDLLLLK